MSWIYFSGRWKQERFLSKKKIKKITIKKTRRRFPASPPLLLSTVSNSRTNSLKSSQTLYTPGTYNITLLQLTSVIATCKCSFFIKLCGGNVLQIPASSFFFSKRRGVETPNKASAWTVPFFLKGVNTMWPFSIYKILSPKPRYVWVQVRILHETEKAVLVENVERMWVPKSQIREIRLRNNVFEVYVKEGMFG